MSFMSPDQRALEKTIFVVTACPFCGGRPVTVHSRRTRFDVDCEDGHTFSLTGPQIRQAWPVPTGSRSFGLDSPEAPEVISPQKPGRSG